MTIRLELEQGGIAHLIFDNPDTRNAMNAEMGEKLSRLIPELDARADVRAVIVRGAGKGFSAGGDFNYIEERANDTHENNRALMKRFYKIFLSVRDLRMPVIAAIHGAAMGAGLCFAMACDLRVAATNARLGLNFVKIGLHPGMGATYFLPRLVGPAKALELLLAGKTIDGEEAARIGLVNQAVPEEQVLETARAIAEEIALAAPNAVARTKASMRRAMSSSLEEALEGEAIAQSLDYAAEDIREGIRAFREKRAPKFSGR